MNLPRMLIAATLAAGVAAPAFAAGNDAKSTVTADKKSQPVNCIEQTGSRIKPKNGECLDVSGRVYTQEQLQQTGQTNLADSLRMLDPSIH
ncbi:hypothetical protein [Solimonas marina]|uniref:Uncharacterized protein n=1 Tax=Solimonas marina TaxID=2714601 RepID=A0A970B9M2_9GAMM|nr:hypothetical protein [Solimonas marina]NKF22521.1 hypothetical protein [Solimonas marina]